MLKKKKNYAKGKSVLIKETISLLKKDFIIEFRSPGTLLIALTFALLTPIVIGLITKGLLSSQTHAIVLWLIIFFCAIQSLAYIFLKENENNNLLFLKLHFSGYVVYISKLIFNILYFLVIEIIIVLVYMFFLQVSIINPMYFLLILFSGGLGISATTTLMSALIVKAEGKNVLFAIISFPVLLPVLWISISSTHLAFSKNSIDYSNVYFLLAFSIAVIAISLLLFPFVWSET